VTVDAERWRRLEELFDHVAALRAAGGGWSEGDRFGPYRIVGEIERGEMGVRRDSRTPIHKNSPSPLPRG
jgi:hypothetical protein